MQYSTLDNPIVVPVQLFAYQTACQYIMNGARVLDVGSGLGYGMQTLETKTGARSVCGVDIDPRAVEAGRAKGLAVVHYDGNKLPFSKLKFDVVTCIDVLEHIADYVSFLYELRRVSAGVVVISTPNRRPENTKVDGTPKNRWHLREWSYDELSAITASIAGVTVEWRFINRDEAGVFSIGSHSGQTQALMPIFHKE